MKRLVIFIVAVFCSLFSWGQNLTQGKYAPNSPCWLEAVNKND